LSLKRLEQRVTQPKEAALANEKLLKAAVVNRKRELELTREELTSYHNYSYEKNGTAIYKGNGI
jgi:hypothetical protein